jgi:D-alanine-D-alanine ligase
MKKNIAILFGGNSAEFEISQRSAEQIYNNIDREKYNAFKIKVRGSDWILPCDTFYDIKINKDDFSYSENNNRVKFDCALIAIHGDPGENGILQAYFDMLDIPYTTGGFFSSALSFNKYVCKIYLSHHLDINLPKGIMVRKGNKIEKSEILSSTGLPCIVKPNNNGSSYGVTLVENAEMLDKALEDAFLLDNEVLIEEFIEGTEITCGVFKTKEKEIIFPLTEIASKNKYFDTEAKYVDGKSDEITPARIKESLEKQCKELSSKIYDILNICGISRIDYILKGNKFYFLEINTVPGMSEASIIPKQAAAIALEMKDLFSMVIEDAIERKNLTYQK